MPTASTPTSPRRGQLLPLVLIGVRVDGIKELITFADGYRESGESWADLVRNAKRRGMRAPVLAVGRQGARVLGHRWCISVGSAARAAAVGSHLVLALEARTCCAQYDRTPLEGGPTSAAPVEAALSRRSLRG